jgi:hypothetical protein
MVLSPAYLQSAFCQPEWTATFAADPTGYEHPHMQAAIRNYTTLLAAMKLPAAEMRRRVADAAGQSVTSA